MARQPFILHVEKDQVVRDTVGQTLEGLMPETQLPIVACASYEDFMALYNRAELASDTTMLGAAAVILSGHLGGPYMGQGLLQFLRRNGHHMPVLAYTETPRRAWTSLDSSILGKFMHVKKPDLQSIPLALEELLGN